MTKTCKDNETEIKNDLLVTLHGFTDGKMKL